MIMHKYRYSISRSYGKPGYNIALAFTSKLYWRKTKKEAMKKARRVYEAFENYLKIEREE